MDAQKVDLYILQNAKNFESHHIAPLREKMIQMDDSSWVSLLTVELKDPTIMLLVSLLAGAFGIDRFMVGDTGLGIIKLLTCGGLGIWTIIDWFLIMGVAERKIWSASVKC